MNKVVINNKVWDRQAIIQLLLTNDFAVVRALLVLYARQTSSEQSSHSTNQHNNRGFTSADAFIMSQYVEYYHKKGFLTPGQLAFCRKPNINGIPRIGKYAKQLLEEVALHA